MKWLSSIIPVAVADTEVVDALPTTGVVGAYIIFQDKVWIWCETPNGGDWFPYLEEEALKAAVELVPHADKIAKMLYRAT